MAVHAQHRSDPFYWQATVLLIALGALLLGLSVAVLAGAF